MTQVLHIGSPPIAIAVRRSARARRLSLRVAATGDGVTLTLPKRVPLREAELFAARHEAWLRKHIAARPSTVIPTFGGNIPLFGTTHRLVSGPGRTRVEDGTITLNATPEQVPAKLRGLLRTLARDRLDAATRTYAEMLGQSYASIAIRDTRSRWGSCSTGRNLNYSFRLVMAPPDVLNYVAAHEVCHLIEMNHSRAYWALVEKVFPGYEVQRKWLRDHGAALHRYQFAPS